MLDNAVENGKSTFAFILSYFSRLEKAILFLKFLILMKLTGFLFLLAILPAAVFAGDFGPSRILSDGEILRGRFVEERRIKGLEKPVRSEGRFVVAPGHGVIWAVEKPLPLTFVFTESGMVQTVGNMPLLQQAAVKGSFLSRAPAMLSAALAGNWKRLENDFSIKRSGTGKSWKVKITPKAENGLKAPFSSITATGKSYVERAEVLRLDGLTDSYIFKDQSITLGPPAGAEAAMLSLTPQ